METACGTPGYVAPELVSGLRYGKEVDLWSLGVVLYIMLCGFPPFYSDNRVELFKRIKKAEFDFPSPYWDEVSESAKSLVKGLLTVKPAERLTTELVLAHPWVSGSSQSTLNIGAHVTDGLRDYQCKRTWKKHQRAVQAVARFTSAGLKKSDSSMSTAELRRLSKAHAPVLDGARRGSLLGAISPC